MSNEKYKTLSDKDIITLIRNKDPEAMDYMLNRYKYLVRQKAKALYLMGGDHEDLIQEGMIGLYKAIRDFDLKAENSFYNFATLCISRQMYSAINASNRKKNQPLNTYISLYSPAYKETPDTNEKTSLVDFIHQSKTSNPEELVIDKESTNMLEYELVRRLSSFENKVLDLYLEGFSYVQIAEILKKETKSIDNALQRIKTKLNKILKSCET